MSPQPYFEPGKFDALQNAFNTVASGLTVASRPSVEPDDRKKAIDEAIVGLRDLSVVLIDVIKAHDERIHNLEGGRKV